MITPTQAVFVGTCECGRQVRRSAPTTVETIEGNGERWVRCRECRHINLCELQKPDTEGGVSA